MSIELEQLPPGAEGYVLDVTHESLWRISSQPLANLIISCSRPAKRWISGSLRLSIWTEPADFSRSASGAQSERAKYAAKRIKSTGSIILTNGLAGLRPQKGWVMVAAIMGAVEAAPAPSRLNWLRSESISFALDWFERSFGEP